MRNLSSLSSTTSTLPATHDSCTITAVTVDLDEDTLYVVSEKTGGSEVEIQVWKVNDEDEQESVASVKSPTIDDTRVITQIVCFTIISDRRSLCLITRSGDIATFSNEGEVAPSPDPQLEVVGTVSPGIVATSFSPDTSLLVLLTSSPNPNLILMSGSSFDVLHEAPLHTVVYGEDKPISVGWGSKTTQFHGSLGKTAAQAQPTDERGTTTPDDDGVPRISWRGDAQFFAVSALQGRRRVLRVYDRLGALQSTAEDVPGLEHVLAWRPSGGLIAGTQRFGNVLSCGGKAEAEGMIVDDKAWALGKGRDGRHDVVFFERNGLRHGDFALREHAVGGIASGTEGDAIVRCWGYRVRELGWSADSSILSVWVERDAGDVVQLWTTGNYHWYLKLEIPAPCHDEKAGRFTSVAWHPEDPFRLILSTRDQVLDTRYTLYTAASHLAPPNDTGLVGVIDGTHILLTPFRTQNVPPPMASHRLPLVSSNPPLHSMDKSLPHSPPVYIAFSPTVSCDVLAALLTNGEVAVWELHVSLKQKRGRREAVVPTLVWRGRVVEAEKGARQVCVQGMERGYVVGVLGEGERKDDVLSIVELLRGEGDVETVYGAGRRWDAYMPGRRGRLVEECGKGAGLVWQASDGGVWDVNLTDQDQHPELVGQFPTFCAFATRVSLPGSTLQFLFIGLSGSKLYVTSSSPFHSDSVPSAEEPPSPALTSPDEPRTHSKLGILSTLTLSPTCTSYTIAGSYLVWTSSAPRHESLFVRLDTLSDAAEQTSLAEQSSALPASLITSFEKRSIERGARIVTAVPSVMSLVLQMPRGNLETVMPRPLVMEQVRLDVQRGDYRAAFLACRKHRVDLNVLVEEDSAKFAASLRSFVEQLDDVDYINLFLSGLGRSSQTPETIAALCDGIRIELEQRDVKKFVNSILTTHVVKTPPDYEAGLALLLRLRGTDPELVEDAVKYIIFLVDADRLFDTALGMYDFSLVLLVAQHSQKDPREYIPFLRTLRAHEGPYQQFKIDEHLKRHGKALRSLHRAGSERFGEAKAYVEKHRLYTEALDIWSDEPVEYCAMLELYGDYLFERREFQPAALAFVQASRARKAMVAYEKALDWQELFEIVVQEDITGDELVDTARRVADDLGSKRRHAEAARVLLDYVDDVDEAVASLVRGSEWSEARRIAVLRKRDDLVASLILPWTLEARSSIADEIVEIGDLLEKQVGRLDELAAKKLAEPDAFYGIEDENLANVDVMTDVSNPGTMFTRYTVAPTASSNRSRRTSRSKRKLDRKAGRKGTVEEEEYLLKSLSKLVMRLEAAKVEAQSLLPHLFVLSDDHAAEGSDLQNEVEVAEREMRDSVERIWKEREAPTPVPRGANTVPGLAGGSGKSLTEKVPKPTILDLPWTISWLANT